MIFFLNYKNKIIFPECTFIILDKEIYSESNDEVESMIGDTNLYFNDPDDDHVAECEIMIGEERARGRKLGWQAMTMMLYYGKFFFLTILFQ